MIPPAIETLLKGKSMLGANRPAWKVEVENTIAGLEKTVEPDKIKSIDIRQRIGTAGQATVVFDNDNARYSPDVTSGDYERLFWPNNILRIEQGYGTDDVRTFTGLISKVEMSRFPAEITVTCWDMYKRALDQLVTDPGASGDLRTHFFLNESPESTFATMAEWAGWAPGEIHTEPTELLLDEFHIRWESYADKWLELTELSGWEIVVDVDGEIHFRQATDRQPEAVDEAVNPVDGTPVDLDHSPIVSDSERVFSGTGETGTEYVKDTHYTMDYGAGTITWIGSAPATVYVSYVYAAWIFREGEDIIQVQYTIDDDDLSWSVVVEGEDDQGDPVWETKAFGPAEYYNVLGQAIEHVLVPESDDRDELEQVAERVEYIMRSRPRRFTFAAIGNPWLELGDCVQVSETSTTVSEIYRIVGMTTRMDESGYTMELETYHYGYAPPPESGP